MVIENISNIIDIRKELGKTDPVSRKKAPDKGDSTDKLQESSDSVSVTQASTKAVIAQNMTAASTSLEDFESAKSL
ncbi:MAG: hypothetical protein HQK59_07440, partial [Deltaproteobacteria bacterium]|nr:hypothetical protein [Deltaproteobacteria bacterium]